MLIPQHGKKFYEVLENIVQIEGEGEKLSNLFSVDVPKIGRTCL